MQSLECLGGLCGIGGKWEWKVPPLEQEGRGPSLDNAAARMVNIFEINFVFYFGGLGRDFGTAYDKKYKMQSIFF